MQREMLELCFFFALLGATIHVFGPLALFGFATIGALAGRR
jgi:hypothetical protein